MVKDYDEAIDYYVAGLILAKVSNQEQQKFIGDQAGDRMFFLSTDDFWGDYNQMLNQGVKFIKEPIKQDYGTVAVFEDLYGNK